MLIYTFCICDIKHIFWNIYLSSLNTELVYCLNFQAKGFVLNRTNLKVTC